MPRRRRVASLLWLCVVVCLCSPFIQTAIAQSETPTLSGGDLTALLLHMQANRRANNEIEMQYVSDDWTRTVVFNASGKKVREHTEKFECLFVDGLPYNHRVEENGKPLSAQKLVSAQRHEDAINALGRGLEFVFDLRDGNPRDSIYSALPICCLATLFENHVLRHEQINGRDNLVVESVPKAYPGALSSDERTALDWKETTWIDLEEMMPTRYEVELLNDKSFLLKGSTERREFFRFEEASEGKGLPPQRVWLFRCKEGHFNLKFLWKRQVETFEDTSYNYKKFKVDMRVVPDSVRDITDQDAGKQR